MAVIAVLCLGGGIGGPPGCGSGTGVCMVHQHIVCECVGTQGIESEAEVEGLEMMGGGERAGGWESVTCDQVPPDHLSVSPPVPPSSSIASSVYSIGSQFLGWGYSPATPQQSPQTNKK